MRNEEFIPPLKKEVKVIVMLDEQTPIRQAIISVSDKTGLIEFVKFLSERGVTIISTGGTAKTIRAQNI